MPVFRQDFDADFDAVAAALSPEYDGPSFALARYADGEDAIMDGRPHVAKSDHWRFDGEGAFGLAAELHASLTCDLPGWHVGITAEEHHPQIHGSLLDEAKVPMDRVTFAELFIFANYRRWRKLSIKHCFIVAPSEKATIVVHPNAVNRHPVELYDLAFKLIAWAKRPILLAAGPAACVIAHIYWQRCPPEDRQVILDVGSALDPFLKGRKTRQYHHPNKPQASWRPKWKLDSQ